MAKKSDDYWQKRFEILQEALLNKGDKYYVDLIRQYEKASKAVQDEILLWYIRLMDNNDDISLAKAKQLLSRQALKEFKWTVEEYIKYGEENAIDQRWMKELENASTRVHISWLQSLQIQMQQEIEALTKMQEAGITSLLQNTYEEGYYRTAYEIQKGLDNVGTMRKLDTDKIEKVLAKPWTVDGKTFSDRIWSNKEQLVDTLNKELTQSIIRGDAPDKVIKTVADKFEKSRKVAGRLVMTESAYFSSQSRLDSYKAIGLEKYKIVATLDLKTSSICRSLDGKTFAVSEYQVSVTAPPFHANCRSTTAPVFEDLEDILSGQRVARDPVTGKTVYIDNMTYPEWYEKYVKGNPQAELNEKKLKYAGADQKKYDDYKQRLGAEYLPKTLDEFQNLKYNDIEEYGILKAQYKGMTYYNRAIENEPEITNQVKKIADTVGMDTAGLEYRIKGKDSYLRKIRSKYSPDGNEYEVKDILRYTYTSIPEDMAGKSLKAMDLYKDVGYNTIEVKNYWLNDMDPYQGINTTITAPSGQKFELQYHTPESFELKNGKMHELYEQQRILSDTSSTEYMELTDQMFELSDTLRVPARIKEVKKK